MSLMLSTLLYDFSLDPFLQFVLTTFVPIIIGILGIYVALWIYWKTRERKEITCEVISDAPIVTINEVLKGKVEIRIGGNLVKDARLLVLKVWNSGNKAVRRDDYEEPIKFEFTGRTVISSDILHMEPHDFIDQNKMKTLIKLEQESVALDGFLLNPKESISLAILLTGPKGEVRARGRIVDGKIVESNDSNSSSSRTIRALAPQYALLGLMIVLLALSISGVLTSPIYLIAVLILAVGSILFGISIIMRRSR